MKKLYVENFGPVKRAEVELRDVNMFIGEQSVGKSTLAKLITIFTDRVSLCGLMARDDKWWQRQLKEYGLDVYADTDYTVAYDMTVGDVELHIGNSHGEWSSYLKKDGKELTGKKERMNEIMDLMPLRRYDKIIPAMLSYREAKGTQETIKHFLSVMSTSLYIPAERIVYSVISNLFAALSLADSTVSRNLLRFMVDLQNAKSKYPDYAIPMFGISYAHEGTDDYIVLDDNQKRLPIAAASSGIQSTMPLMMVLDYAIQEREYSTFVVEEPECNLFPEKQVELLKYILAKVKGGHRTLTITTHSPYLLSAMNNYLFAGKMVADNGDDVRTAVAEILPADCLLMPGECAVYSLGESVNGDGTYCKSLLDEATGMVDFNALDSASGLMDSEFDALQDVYIRFKCK